NKINPVATPGSSGTGIVWAAVTGGGTFRLYESAAPSATGPSGLILGPTPGTTSISGSSNADLVLQTNNSIAFPYLTITTGKALSINNRDADFGFTSPTAYFAGGLAAQMFSGGDL